MYELKRLYNYLDLKNAKKHFNLREFERFLLTKSTFIKNQKNV